MRRRIIIAAASLFAGILGSSASVTTQGWWHYGEVPGDYYFDSSGNGHRFGQAFSRVGSGNAGAAVEPLGVGGPLGTTGFVSTNCLFWTPSHADAAGMWGPGYNPPATNYGIELWVLPEYPGTRGGNGAWMFCSGSSGGVRFQLTNDDSAQTMTITANIVGNNARVGDPLIVDTNSWTHLAIVNENGTNTFYVNGIRHGAPDVSNATVPAGDIFAGSAPGTQPTYDGYLDELRIFTFAAGQFSTNDLLLRPSGPNIIVQPESASVWEGGAAPFDIGTSFDTSTKYQWRRGGANLGGATGTEYYLASVSAADSAATFDCVVNNSSTIATTSSVATLTIVPQRTADVNFYRSAVQAEAGLVAYFPVDGDTGTTLSNTKDATHNGTFEGNAEYDGRTNRAFGVRALKLNGDGDVSIPNNSAFEFASGNGTVEAVVYLGRGLSAASPTIFALGQDSSIVYYQIMASPDGTSLIYTNDLMLQPLTWSMPVPLLGRQAHMAFVFTNQTVTAYVDGLSLGTKPNPSFGQNLGLPAYIGSVGLSSDGVWTGTIDELAIYSTALSANTIAIHNSRFIYGTNVTAPTITAQPGTAKTLLAGGSPTFTVQAAGTAPLSYQWYFQGNPIQTATAATLTLSQTTTGSSGSYYVKVSNPIGSTNSDAFTLTFVAPADTYAARVMSDNPSAYWRLDETSGTTLYDSAGGHDGTYSGTLTLGAAGALPGVTDTAVAFAGGHAEVPYSATLNPSTAFTIEFWANPVDQNTYVPLCSQFRNGSGRSGWCFYDFNDANTFECHFGNPGGVAIYCYGGGPAPVGGEWYHVAAVYDGTNTVTLYSEAQVVGQNTQIGSGGNFVPNPSAPLEIGVRNGGAFAWNGSLDEVAIYNYALSYNQISNHWHSKFVASQVVQQPAGVTNVEGSTITLAPVVSGFPNTYQWFKDNVALAPVNNFDSTPHYSQDVTNLVLVIDQATPADSGLYHLVTSNPLGGSTTLNARVLILADTNPPTALYATALATPNASGPTPFLVKLGFDKRIDPNTGAVPAKYTINGGVNVISATVQSDQRAATLGADWRAVMLTTSGLTPGQKYTVSVSGVKDQTAAGNLVTPAILAFTAPVITQGLLYWDYYYLGSVSGGVDALVNSTIYQLAAPMTNATTTVFDSTPITGGDLNNNPAFGSLGDNYGAVLSGWLTPAVTTNYVFYLSSDDASRLLLSTDETVAGAQLIVEETGCCHPFNDPLVPVSAPTSLVAGKRYFIQALQVEGSGNDYVKVGWRMDGDTNAPSGPIPAAFLSGYAQVPAPKFLPVIFSGGQLTLTWTGTGALQESTDLKTWTNVPGNPASGYVVTPNVPYKFYRLAQ